jgi:hypothetical protein
VPINRRKVLGGAGLAGAAAATAVGVDRLISREVFAHPVASRWQGQEHRFGALAAAVSGADYARAYVLDYGADPTGVADSTTAFTEAIAALPSTGGRVYAPAGIYKISSTLAFTPPQCLRGDGSGVTKLKYYGTGPCIQAGQSGAVSALDRPYVSFEGFTIDGNGTAGTGAIGLEMGQLHGPRAKDVVIQYFTTAGAIGLYLHNAGTAPLVFERARLQIDLHYNTTGVVFDTGSFMYSYYDFYIQGNANMDGITIQNAANLQGSSLIWHGNFGTGVTNTGWVIAMDYGNTSGTSSIVAAHVDIVFECDGPGGQIGHQTVVMGSTSLAQFTGTGVMDFVTTVGGGAQFQGASIAAGSWLGVSGYINDPVLGTMYSTDCAAFHGGTQWNVYGSNTFHIGTGTTVLCPAYADVQEILLNSGNITISGFQNAPYLRARKMEILFHQPASGAPGTITWPTNVKWSGGVHTLSTANSAVDKVRLTYFPSDANWYAELLTAYA